MKSMSPERWNFSKSADQEQFSALPKGEQDIHIEKAHEQAEIIEQARREMQQYLQQENINQDTLQIPESVVQTVVEKKMTEIIAQGYWRTALALKEHFSAPDTIFQSPKVQAAIQGRMSARLRQGRIEEALEMKEKFHASDETIQAAAKEGIAKCLRQQRIDEALEMKEKFHASDETIQAAAKEGIACCFEYGRVDFALTIKEKFHASDDIIRAAAQEGIIRCLEGNGVGWDRVTVITRQLQIPDTIFQSPEVQTAVRKAIAIRFQHEQVDSILTIIDTFQASENTVHTTAKEWIVVHLLQQGQINRILAMKQKLQIPDTVFQSPEVQAAAKIGVILCLQNNKIADALITVEQLHIPDTIFQSPKVQAVAEESMLYCLRNGRIDDVLTIKQRFQLPETIVNGVAEQELAYRLQANSNYDVTSFIREFQFSDTVFQLPKVKDVVREIIQACFQDMKFDVVPSIIQKFQVSDNIIHTVAKEWIVGQLFRQGQVDQINAIKQKLQIPDTVFQSPEVQTAVQGRIVTCLSQGRIDDALTMKEKLDASDTTVQAAAQEGIIRCLQDGNTEAITRIQFAFNVPTEFIKSPEFQNVVKAAKIYSRVDVTGLEMGDIQVDSLSEDELRDLFAVARRKLSVWQDEQTIAMPFETAAADFGYKQMLDYIHKKDVSLHDAIHAFPVILDLYAVSGLSVDVFYANILHQVRMDNQEYDEGTAHQHFNSIALSANKDIGAVLAQARQYPDIKQMQALASSLTDPREVFASWASLKKYSELEQLLGQTNVLNDLQRLRQEGKGRLGDYVETLAFHPDSKVNMGAAIQLWREPEAFLAADAAHTPESIHNRKKPSNYVHMPNLDLSASELRDALVEGDMDTLCVFTPMQVHYQILMGETRSLSTRLQEALGSQKNNVKGKARDPKKLFSELGKVLKPHGVNLIDYLKGKVRLNPEVVEALQVLLYDQSFGMPIPKNAVKEFAVEINRKSDPAGVLAGDDTACCMPFGDGKNTVYMFNPNTAQLIVRIKKEDGKWRTIAQSVLTKDLDIKTPIPEVIEHLQNKGGHLQDVLSQDIVVESPVYVACDNIELAGNYRSEEYIQVIGELYHDFFFEYMRRYAKTEGLDPSRVPIGKGYTTTFPNLKTETNTFAPQAPVSYSDKIGEQVYMLHLDEPGMPMNILGKEVAIPTVPEKQAIIPPSIKGVEYLTFKDTLKVGYIEGKAYADNQSLMQFLFDLENGLIAKDINNAAKKRPNMSLKYIDKEGKMCGYLLAWEGKITDIQEDEAEERAKGLTGQSCIYVSDLASDREHKLAGGRLIQGFVELYERHYLDQGFDIPIYMQSRETTSYRIVKRQLDSLGKKLGREFELIEFPTYPAGMDIMYPIIIRPVTR